MEIGAQFYTVRELCKDINGFADTLKRVADIGYKNVQISGTCEFDPEWLKVYVDDESKRLCLNFKDSFAPITVEVKDIEKQIVFQSIIFPVAAGEYSLYLGDLSLGQYELYMYNASVKVVGNFTL